MRGFCRTVPWCSDAPVSSDLSCPHSEWQPHRAYSILHNCNITPTLSILFGQYWSYPLTQHVFWSKVGCFCIKELPCSVSFPCLELVTWRFERRTFCIGSLRVKTHFSMPRGAKMNLAFNETQALHSNASSTSEHAPQLKRNYLFWMLNNQWKIIRDQLPTKCPIVF